MVLKPISARLIGIDLSPDMIELARKRAIYDLLEVAEITDWLDRTNEHFDLISCCDCLIYFGDLKRITAAAAKRLKPGGIFALTTESGPAFRSGSPTPDDTNITPSTFARLRRLPDFRSRIWNRRSCASNMARR